jgi:protein-arginine kinase activator protein McsA
MLCSSCSKPKAELHPRKSRLLAGTMLYLCNDCAKAKMEPRYIIILHGRSNGAESVSDYIRNHRYVGKPILAKELVR